MYESTLRGPRKFRRFDMEKSPADDLVELSIPLKPWEELSSERLLFATGTSYHAQLLTYGSVIRQLHHARVSRFPWVVELDRLLSHAVNQGESLVNTRLAVTALEIVGLQVFQINEGYQYARGEFETANATQFPSGMRVVGHHITGDGLTFGLWTAPFEIATTRRVCEHHKGGCPQCQRAADSPWGCVNQHVDTLYALDTTNPGAQEYLRQTYRRGIWCGSGASVSSNWI